LRPQCKSEEGCPYKQKPGASKLAEALIKKGDIWDLEDLDNLAATHSSCRFYGTRCEALLARPLFRPYTVESRGERRLCVIQAQSTGWVRL
jgi:hypothetical protein